MTTYRKNGDPFKHLSLRSTPKSLFERGTYEYDRLTTEEQITLLYLIVRQGYDLHRVVQNYLSTKEAGDDDGRKMRICDTFNHYTTTLLFAVMQQIEARALQPEEVLPDGLIELFPRFLGSDQRQSTPDNLDEAIACFVAVVQHDTMTPYASQYRNEAARLALRELIELYAKKPENPTEEERYQELSSLLGIDLREDVNTTMARLWKHYREQGAVQFALQLEHLYSEGRQVLQHAVATNEIDWDAPLTPPFYQALLKKYFPIEERTALAAKEEFRHERILDFAEKIVRTIWKLEELFDESVFLFRVNFKQEHPPYEELDRLYRDNILPICIETREAADREAYNALMAGGKSAKAAPYIARFVALVQELKKRDVMVVASYFGKGVKIGLLKRGDCVFDYHDPAGRYTLHCLRMKSVYLGNDPTADTIDLHAYPLMKSLIPQQITISPIRKRHLPIQIAYYGLQPYFTPDLSWLSDAAIEVMCAEWLRSPYAGESLRLNYQLLRTGGNNPDIDLLGIHCEPSGAELRVAAQITSSKQTKTVQTKAERLKETPYEVKILFSGIDEEMIVGCPNICLDRVWNDFAQDPIYRRLLERLAMQ